MTKEEIAGVLEQIATLLELKNENPFKIRAYTNAARAIETFGGNVTNFQDEEALSKIPRRTERGIPLRNSRIVLTVRAWRQEDQGSLRQTSNQFHRAAAKGLRNRGCR